MPGFTTRRRKSELDGERLGDASWIQRHVRPRETKNKVERPVVHKNCGKWEWNKRMLETERRQWVVGEAKYQLGYKWIAVNK